MASIRLHKHSLFFKDPSKNQECEVIRSPLRAYAATTVIEGINILIHSSYYHGILGNKKAQERLATLQPNQFFIRYSKKEKDFVLCCKSSGWSPSAGWLGKGKKMFFRVNLGDILAYAPGGQFDVSLFMKRRFWSKANTALSVQHYGLIQAILNQLPNVGMLCSTTPPRPALLTPVSSSASTVQVLCLSDIPIFLANTTETASVVASTDTALFPPQAETYIAACLTNLNIAIQSLRDDPAAQLRLLMLIQTQFVASTPDSTQIPPLRLGYKTGV